MALFTLFWIVCWIATIIISSQVGKQIIKWLDDNRKSRTKPGTQKELCSILENSYHYNLKPPQFNRYIKGINKMPAQLEYILTSSLGFNSDIFVKHHAAKDDKLTLEHLTTDELYKLIAEQKQLLNEWKDMYFNLANRNSKHQEDFVEVIKSFRTLLAENEKQKEKIKELKRELSQSD